MNITNLIKMKHFSGAVKLTSNGDGAKTAKVTITARSGDPIDIPGFGAVVHDFASMSSKSRIPLDIDHDDSDSIGYLNNFDASSGDLVCSGAIVLTDPNNAEDEVTQLVQKILSGVPYEASIETDDDMALQFVPEGTSVVVNGNTVSGPVTVVTDWTLKAVAVCKFGADADTSTTIQLSKKKSEDAQKGFYVRFANSNTGKQTMNKEITKLSDAITLPAVKASAVEVKAETAPVTPAVVEATTEAPKATETIVEKVEAVVKEVETKAVEAVKEVEKVVEEVVTDVKAEVAKVETAVESKLSTTSVDPRKEFAQFVTSFGNEKAAIYFSEGLTLADAMVKFSAALKAENADLKTKLAAVDRGADSPVRFSKVDAFEGAKGTRKLSANAGQKGLAAIVTLQNK